MCNEHFDVAIIGAGPAGLFLAKEILENSNQKVVLIDSGPSIKKRHCPLIQKGNCTKCPTCHVVEGVGGAGMYSDGKLSSYPAGSGLVELLGSEEKVIEINNYVLESFLSGMSAQNIKETKADKIQSSGMQKNAATQNLNWKGYDVYHIGTEGIIEYCIQLEEQLLTMGLHLLTNHKMVDIEKFHNIFTLSLENKRRDISYLFRQGNYGYREGLRDFFKECDE
ncbi:MULTISPECIES: lycopene cyclase family protein [Bacillus]|uniref:lycopene cyclase family protein n=1 Tax=Bacillus TaxID=1386 RepID=UPI001F5CACB6|nr:MULTISPECIES: lycopene cyclase family protein [Bacillus]